jgi:hypothetical protein
VLGFFKKKAKPNFGEIRELLFGDVPLSEWKSRDPNGDSIEPWASFVTVRDAVQRGDTAAAIATLRRIVSSPGVESRQQLQASYFLRQLGVHPSSADGKRVHGVVLEVQLEGGLDTLAGYADHTARYINHGRRLIVWESHDDSIDALIDDLIGRGQVVANAIGPWDAPRRLPPPVGHVRLNMLTSAGLHFGEGAFPAMAADPLGGPLIAAGTKVMKALIERARAPA